MAQLSKMVSTIDLAEPYVSKLQHAAPDVEFVICTDREKLPEVMHEAQAVFGDWLNANLLAACPSLKWAQTHGAGVDAYLFPELVESDVVVTNLSGLHASNIAEHVLGMMLAFARGFPQLVINQHYRYWQQPSKDVFELGYQTLAIVGLGDIGHALAIRAKALGMRVIGTRRRRQEPMEGVDQVFNPDDLRAMLAEADHVVITVPLTRRTRGLFGPSEFKTMKRNAYIYNVGRGEIIDQVALINALESGRLRGAGLDVTSPEPLPEESPLWRMPDVFITAHTSGSTPHYWERAIDILSENIRRFKNDEPLMNVVDKREGY